MQGEKSGREVVVGLPENIVECFTFTIVQSRFHNLHDYFDFHWHPLSTTRFSTGYFNIKHKITNPVVRKYRIVDYRKKNELDCLKTFLLRISTK